MVKLTLDKPYTVHARSIDRIGVGSTPSSYKLMLRDPITCDQKHYMKCTLISAKIPSTFYIIDKTNNQFTITFNDPSWSVFAPWADHDVVMLLEGKTKVRDYKRTLTVNIQKGNYNIEELLNEIKDKLNAACTAANNDEAFRTFLRGTLADPKHNEDLNDSDQAAILYNGDPAMVALSSITSIPQFDWEYNKRLNKMRLYRTDIGGKVVLGKYAIETSGMRLAMALGFNHVTAQLAKDLNLDPSEKSSTELSVHYRELPNETTWNDFTIQTPDNGSSYGHTINSPSCVNMYANDSVYVRMTNFPSNAYETLYGGQSNVMAVIPMYAGASSENFHSPSNPITSNIGKMIVSELDVKLTDAMGYELDFNNVEHEFQLLFETYEEGSRPHRPPDNEFRQRNVQAAFDNIHQVNRVNTRRDSHFPMNP